MNLLILKAEAERKAREKAKAKAEMERKQREAFVAAVILKSIFYLNSCDFFREMLLVDK